MIEKAAAVGAVVHRPAGGVHDEARLGFRGIHFPQPSRSAANGNLKRERPDAALAFHAGDALSGPYAAPQLETKAFELTADDCNHVARGHHDDATEHAHHGHDDAR